MNDQQWQILQEFEAIVKKNEKTGMGQLLGEMISAKPLKELQKKRRNAFDYKIIRMLDANNIPHTDVRRNLDRIWKSIEIHQSPFQRYTRFTTLWDMTDVWNVYLWEEYINGCEKLIKKLIGLKS